MIFVDSNIPMYVVGQSHPNKVRVLEIVPRLLREGERLVIDAEVLQEILHRYVAIDRRMAIDPCFRALLALVDTVFPIELPHLVRAKDLVREHAALSARDALHLAVMEDQGITRFLTFDRGFERVGGLQVLR